MDRRIDIIRKIMDKVEFLPDYADEILWTKEQGYADNYWFRFRSGNKSHALYLQGEEYCANIDFRLYICDSIDEAGIPIGEMRLIQRFDHHDVSLAMAWAEEWLLHNLDTSI